MRTLKRLAAVVALVISVFALATEAQASGGAYIQINNGNIVTNQWQQPQVVVQFGNRGSSTISNVDVECQWSYYLGRPGAVYPGPFRYVQTLNDFGGRDVAEFGANIIDAVVIDHVTLIPGQNYNVAYNIYITAPRGTSGSVQCRLFQDYYTFLAQTPWVPIYVQ